VTALPPREVTRLGELLGLTYRLMVAAEVLADAAGPASPVPPALAVLAGPCAAAALAVRAGAAPGPLAAVPPEDPFFAFHA
ncbi:hypothetical protein, partial [Klebsiella pneumoniae]|uniref:hypothetical protein n=1 Tax=Klebsiella pneumoniae TaxID=573 RepID=UPI001952D017